MKSILLSIRPEWVAKILNGEKTIEIRKKFPKDYVGLVYIYCTKDKQKDIFKSSCYNKSKEVWLDYYDLGDKNYLKIKRCGKVVARFWCDKVEDIYVEEWDADYGWEHYALETKEISHDKLIKKSCLSEEQLWDYLGVDLDDYYPPTVGYAIHISKLEVFDKPRELWEFEKEGSWMKYRKFCNPDKKCNLGYSLKYPNKYIGCEKARVKKAPQNYCYVEGEK